MFFVSMDKYKLISEDTLKLTITIDAKYNHFEYVQIEIYRTGVLNKQMQYSTSKNVDERVEFDIDLSSFKSGYYELGRIIFHNSTNQNKEILKSQKNFQREVFQIVENLTLAESREEVLGKFIIMERTVEELFKRSLDLSNGANGTKDYQVIVFIENLMMKTNMRINKFSVIANLKELISLHKDNYVKDFLKDYLGIGANVQTSSKTPVTAICYDSIKANDEETVKNYCLEDSGHIIRALSLSRDTGGKIFKVVLIDKTSSKFHSYTVNDDSYTGNLLGGIISGENVDKIEEYYNGLKNDSMSSFLVNLYKEAHIEKSRDFKYVRLWQILETLAESKNYSNSDDLTNKDGTNILKGDGTNMKVKGSTAIVFNLLKNLDDLTYEDVKVWFAFRNAVAHHGSILRYTELDRVNVRNDAARGISDIQVAGYDIYLIKLESKVKEILIKEVTV